MHIGHQTVIKFCFNKNKNTVNPRRVANEVCVENKPTFLITVLFLAYHIQFYVLFLLTQKSEGHP